MRLATRLFLLISFLIALTVGTAVAVTLILSARIGRQTITERLEKGDALRQRQDEDRYDRFQLLADLFVADANLIAYVAEAQTRADSASILDLLLERQDDLGFEFAVVTDPDGYVLARTDDLTAAGEDLALEPLFGVALEEFRSAGLWRQDGALFHAVVIPLVQGGTDLLGFFATAYPVDDFAASESKRLDGSEVAYTLFSPAGSNLVASSFDTVLAPAIAPSVTAWTSDDVMALSGEGAVTELIAGGEQWLVHRSVLEDSDGQSLGLRLTAASLRQETAGFRRVGTALAAVGLGTVLLGFLLTYLLAHRIAQPLSRLVGAAREARGGQYETEIPVARKDEIGDLGREFRALLNELREKREMETYVAELSRNLPDAELAASPRSQAARKTELTLMAVEFRSHAGMASDGDAEAQLGALEDDLTSAAGEVVRSQGSVVAFSGHRILSLFEGIEHPSRALKVAIDVCARAEEGHEPTIALGFGTVATGVIEWQSQRREVVCGRPTQMVETLLREGTSGEILLPVTMRDALLGNPALAHVDFPERLGVMTSLRYCVVDGTEAQALQTLAASAESASPERGLLFAPGQVIVDRFEILSVAGTGGMGVVYRARDRKLGDVVALKTLRSDAWRDRYRVELLKQEIKLARKITHPNVLRVYDLGEFSDVPFISMEYVRGVTLRLLLDKTPRLPFSAAMRLAQQICLGLRAVHQAGILHHDMKPENVLLEPTGNARLMDFGIAAPATVGATPQEGTKTQGTPYYLAPEQLKGETVDARADIFATGLLLFELFTGGKPFRAAKTLNEIIKIKLTEKPLSAAEVWPEIPVALDELLARCLQRTPDARLSSASELLAGLDQVSRRR